MSLLRHVSVVIPNRYAILGIKLRPLSVGHYLILSAFKSPFVYEELSEERLEALKRTDLWIQLLFALSVCRHSFEDFIEIINDDELFKSETKAMNKAAKKSIRYQRKNKSFNPLEKFSLFREYLREGFTVPSWTYANSGKGSGKSSKHWSEQLVEDLVTKSNRSRSEVLNMHMAEAWSAWAHIAEDAGAINLMSDEETNRIKELAKTGDTNLAVENGGWEKLLAAYEAKHGKGALVN